MLWRESDPLHYEKAATAYMAYRIKNVSTETMVFYFQYYHANLCIEYCSSLSEGDVFYNSHSKLATNALRPIYWVFIIKPMINFQLLCEGLKMFFKFHLGFKKNFEIAKRSENSPKEPAKNKGILLHRNHEERWSIRSSVDTGILLLAMELQKIMRLSADIKYKEFIKG